MELELIKNFFIGKQLCGIEYTQFPDGERKINIIKGKHKEIRHSDLKESEAVLLHSLINDKSIIDLCLILNALSYNDSVDSIYLTIPYMGYARQDRQNAIGECVSVIAILRMILAQTNKIKSISFCDIHNPEIFSELPSGIVYKNIYPHIATDYITGFLEELSKYKYITLDNVTFVACDAGGATRARALNKAMKIKHDIAIIDKERKEDGEVEMSNILGETVQTNMYHCRRYSRFCRHFMQISRIIKSKWSKRYICIYYTWYIFRECYRENQQFTNKKDFCNRYTPF